MPTLMIAKGGSIEPPFDLNQRGRKTEWGILTLIFTSTKTKVSAQ